MSAMSEDSLQMFFQSWEERVASQGAFHQWAQNLQDTERREVTVTHPDCSTESTKSQLRDVGDEEKVSTFRQVNVKYILPPTVLLK